MLLFWKVELINNKRPSLGRKKKKERTSQKWHLLLLYREDKATVNDLKGRPGVSMVGTSPGKELSSPGSP